MEEITEMEAANRYLRETCLPAFNAEFARPPKEERAAFVPLGSAGPGRDPVRVARAGGGPG